MHQAIDISGPDQADGTKVLTREALITVLACGQLV